MRHFALSLAIAAGALIAASSLVAAPANACIAFCGGGGGPDYDVQINVENNAPQLGLQLVKNFDANHTDISQSVSGAVADTTSWQDSLQINVTNNAVNVGVQAAKNFSLDHGSLSNAVLGAGAITVLK